MAHNTTLIENRNFNYYDWDAEYLKTNTIVEYIWIDGTGKGLRGKTKVCDKKITTLEELPWWTYDGSSTEQAITSDSEIWIKPVCLYKDPFRKNGSLIALCQGYMSDQKTPAPGCFRQYAEKVFKDCGHEDPWFGIEQEYFLFVRQGTTHRWPLGWPQDGFPFRQGRYYCGVGDFNCFGRAIVEQHLRLCLESGVQLAGVNAEVAPGQWEYQVGICKGIQCGDDMWLAKYILLRLGEEYGLDVIFDPKPIRGDWNGSGCHTNFSTNSTRAEGGLDVIVKQHMPKLKEKHLEHIFLYGEGNTYRLTGSHETAAHDVFNYAEGNRGSSVRIPVTTISDKFGYYEDRRPASNIDPYLVSAIIADTTILNSKYCSEIVNAYKEFRKRREDDVVVLSK